MQTDSDTWVVVDTNILVYLADEATGARNDRASDVVLPLLHVGRAAITGQIIGEFFHATTLARRGRRALLSKERASHWCVEFLDTCHYLETTSLMVLEALRGATEYQMQIFDALIWATAKLGGIRTVLTEDLPGRTNIEGVHYLNPFAPGFSLSRIGL